MKFIIVKPPTLSLWCYAIGFIVLLLAVSHHYFGLRWLSVLVQQQLFLAGAIIVAVGSVINWLNMLKPKSETYEKN
jgi:uncharacterized membrane protein